MDEPATCRRGFRFIALADDNFYPVTKADLAMAARRLDKSGLKALEDVRKTWDSFYSLPAIWRRSSFLLTLKGRLAFVLISKLYRQMYANTGIATDSARHVRAGKMARLIARPCRRLFVAKATA